MHTPNPSISTMNHRHLLIAALLLLACSVRLVVSDDSDLQADISFYKLSLVWPPSVCNQPGTDCKPAVLTSFKVLGFWPFNSGGDIVQCPITRFIDITEELRPIYEKLTKEWPDVKDYLSKEANEEVWRSQWIRYGNCSDWPHNPRIYFDYALLLNDLHNSPFNGTGIKPGFVSYKARRLSEAVKSKLGVYPEIACNKLGETLQLREIRICVNRNRNIRPQVPAHELQDCPSRYAYKCQYDDDQVRIPLPPVFY